MGRSWAVLPLGVVVACGGSAFTTVPVTGNDSGGPDAASGDDRIVTLDSPGATDSPSFRDAGVQNDASSGDGGFSGDVIMLGCPFVDGTYGILTSMGQGCGDLNLLASECVKQDNCDIKFVSPAAVGGSAAVNGGALLDGMGSFANATLTLGSVQRTGCTGSWKGGPTQSLTVDCGGGDGGSQDCAVTMTRTSGGSCP